MYVCMYVCTFVCMYVSGFYLENLVWGEATLCNSARKFLELATPIFLLKPHDNCSANRCRHYIWEYYYNYLKLSFWGGSFTPINRTLCMYDVYIHTYYNIHHHIHIQVCMMYLYSVYTHMCRGIYIYIVHINIHTWIHMHVILHTWWCIYTYSLGSIVIQT